MKKPADLPTTLVVTKTMAEQVSSMTPVRMGEVMIMVTISTTRVAMEEMHWGMDMEIIWRRVSMSLV